jgi:amino-acid N-acetyltransferase
MPAMSKPRTQQKLEAFVKWFRTAAPFIHQFGGQTFVIGFGGEVLSEGEFMQLAHDINVLVSLEVRVILVHGTRPQIEDQLRQHAVPSRYEGGRRVTDEAALRCVKEANGIVRIDIEALLSNELANSPMAESDIRVSSGNFITAKPVGVLNGVDFMHTGEVRKVDTEGIRRRLDDHEVVLISPVGFSPSGDVFNCTMEDVATAVAIATRADKLIFFMEAAGVVDVRQRFISELTVSEAEDLILQAPAWSEDVKLFLPAAIRAAKGGVARTHLISRHVDGALLMELFTHHGIGTMVVPEAPERLRPATTEDVEGIVQLLEPLEQKGVLVYRDRERMRSEIERYIVLELDEEARSSERKIIGCCAYYTFPGERMAELAAVAVNPHYRDGGRGERLLRHVESLARKDGMRTLFVLSTQTMQWFSERGFNEAPLEALPAARRASYRFDRMSKIYLKTL